VHSAKPIQKVSRNTNPQFPFLAKLPKVGNNNQKLEQQATVKDFNPNPIGNIWMKGDDEGRNTQ
jgi:hypothetical protein